MTSEIYLNTMDILTGYSDRRKVSVQRIKIKCVEQIRDAIVDFFALYRMDKSKEQISYYIVGAGREREMVRVRQYICYFAYLTTPASLSSIGKALGGRDHSTVIHSIRKIEDGMTLHKGKPIDPVIAQTVKDITNYLITK
jgi:chromosomal replication initiation ATPase DnaA